MRLTKEALSIRVVVRRAKRGAGAFVWEINRDSMVEPMYVSSEVFKSMEAAYRAGQARLAEFIPAPPSFPEVIEEASTHARLDEVEEAMAFVDAGHVHESAARVSFG